MSWLAALGLAAVPFLFLVEEILKDRIALAIGASLVVIDFVIQTTGKVLGLWVSKGSLAFIGGAPVEVLAIAFMGGSLYGYLLKGVNRDIILFGVVAIGLLGELAFIRAGLLEYIRWDSLNAAIFYFSVFIVAGALESWLRYGVKQYSVIIISMLLIAFALTRVSPALGVAFLLSPLPP